MSGMTTELWWVTNYARHFNGTSDDINFSVGSVGAFGVSTIAAIVTVTPNAAYKVIFSGGAQWQFGLAVDESLNVFNGTADSEGTTILVADEWYLVGATKATGTVAPRFHIYRYSTGAWVHENGGTNLANSSVATTNTFIGSDNGGALFWPGRVQAVAYWTSVISDGNFETMETGKAAWSALSPAALWVLNQGSVATAVADEIGAADQTAISGTVASVAGCPDWDDGSLRLSGNAMAVGL